MRTLTDTPPREWFDQQREIAPVFFHPPTSSWYVTRFADVWDLLVDPRLGARRLDVLVRRLTPEQREACADLIDFASRWPMFLDPPDHALSRRSLLPLFSAADVRRVADAVRTATDANVRHWDDGEPVADVLRPACRAGLATLLGLDVGDLAQIGDWSQRVIAFVSGPSYDTRVVQDATRAFQEFAAFVLGSCTRRSSSRLGRLLWRSMRDGTLTAPDVVAHYAQLVTGALEPTAVVLATAVELLSARPVLGDDYATDPMGFLTELFRVATPFHYVARRALVDLELHGAAVAAGDRVVLVLVAANRDPRRFPDPLAFRVDADRTPHVAFGRGRHACLGAGLATRMAMAALDVIVTLPLHRRPPLRAAWRDDLGMRLVLRLERPA